jgi:release factor glutamine methyltransferase
MLHWTEQYFRARGIDTPRLDGEILLAHVLGCRRIDLYLQHDRPLTAGELRRYRELVKARADRTPVAYLVGTAGFWSLTLAVGPGCLVPRPDSEALVEATLQAAAALRASGGAPEAPLLVLELGTGSGALPLAVCSETRAVRWIAVERSAPALAVARANRDAHPALLAPRGNALLLVRGDGFSALAPGCRPDLIVSNPPYIPSAQVAGLMPEVALAEPREALDGGPDGTDLHRYLMDFAAASLRPGGRLLMEMGPEQAPLLQALLRRHPSLAEVALHRDLARRPRVYHAEQRGVPQTEGAEP